MMENTVNPAVVRARQELNGRFREAEPFRHVVIDEFFTPGFCDRLMREFPAFDEKLAINENGEVGGKAVHEQVSDIGPAYAELDSLCRSRDFRELVGDITGIPDLQFDPHYFGGGTHENLDGQSLDAHVDFNLHPVTRQHRRLNLIIYLNPEWEDGWGGSIRLHRDPYLPPSQDEITAVTPLANRCVIFETNDHSWHGFPRIDLPEGKKHLSRRSFALYYYTDTRPDEELEPEHSTIYVEEHLPEWYQPGMTLDAEQLQHIRTLVTRRDQHLKRLYGDIMRQNEELDALRKRPEAPTVLSESAKAGTHEEALELIDRLKRDLDASQTRIRELERSTSWRVTAPLRAIKRLVAGR
jgi:hypothetical protein